jgi:glutamyl-tRNA synthetase
MGKVRTRFAPSPTGFLHIGSLRTALYAYALAKHSRGDFILRIEDTDRKREVSGAVDSLQKTLRKFGLGWDEYYVQSERNRKGIYKDAAKKLIKEGHAFYCQCKAKNAKEEGFSKELRDPCRNKRLTSGAIKLLVPDDVILSYNDFVHKKEISWNSSDVYDATLLKSDGYPTYHLAAMTDDLQMKVSHILRGHDWLPSTPIHLLVFDYLGGKRPHIGHLTDVLSPKTGKKLSKRRDSVFAEQFLEEGYLPEALLNFVMLLGWAPKDNRELFTLKEFVEAFDIDGFQEANPKFFEDKLNWFNQQYLQRKFGEDKKEEFVGYLKSISQHKDEPNFEQVALSTASFMPSRMANIKDYDEMTTFFYGSPKVDKKLLGGKYREHLELAVNAIESINNWNLENLNDNLIKQINNNNFKVGDFFMDVRIAITGSKFTPPINDSMIILGKEETLRRLKSLL